MKALAALTLVLTAACSGNPSSLKTGSETPPADNAAASTNAVAATSPLPLAKELSETLGGGDFMLGLSLDKLRQSALWRKHGKRARDRWLAPGSKLSKAARGCSFDLVNAWSVVIIAGSVDQGAVLAAVQGPPRDEVEACLRHLSTDLQLPGAPKVSSEGELTTITADGTEILAMSWVRDSVFVVGIGPRGPLDGAKLRAALADNKTENAQLVTAVNALLPGHAGFAVIEPRPSGQRFFSAIGLSSASFVGDVLELPWAAGRVEFKTTKIADELRKELAGPPADLGLSFDVRGTERTLELRVEMTVGKAVELVSLFFEELGETTDDMLRFAGPDGEKRRKTTEARQFIKKIYDGARAHYMSQSTRETILAPQTYPMFPTPAAGPTPPLGTCCKQGGRCAVDGKLWDKEPWRSLVFSVDDPHLYSYEYRVYNSNSEQKPIKGATPLAKAVPGAPKDSHFAFEARAYGDLDCDGIYSTFAIRGVVNDAFSDGPAGTAEIRVINELE